MATQRIFEYMRDRQSSIVELIRTLVEIESPTQSKAGVDRVVSAVADVAGRWATVTRYPQEKHGDHLRLEFDIPTRGDGQVLGLGHLDTVWPIGTLERMPWRVANGRLWGPGGLRHEGRSCLHARCSAGAPGSERQVATALRRAVEL